MLLPLSGRKKFINVSHIVQHTSCDSISQYLIILGDIQQFPLTSITLDEFLLDI